MRTSRLTALLAQQNEPEASESDDGKHASHSTDGDYMSAPSAPSSFAGSDVSILSSATLNLGGGGSPETLGLSRVRMLASQVERRGPQEADTGLRRGSGDSLRRPSSEGLSRPSAEAANDASPSAGGGVSAPAGVGKLTAARASAFMAPAAPASVGNGESGSGSSPGSVSPLRQTSSLAGEPGSTRRQRAPQMSMR